MCPKNPAPTCLDWNGSKVLPPNIFGLSWPWLNLNTTDTLEILALVAEDSVTSKKLAQLLSTYESIFKKDMPNLDDNATGHTWFQGIHENLGQSNEASYINIDPIKIHLKPGTVPRCLKARQLPLMLLDKVRTEIRGLIRDNFVYPVEYSEWASPIVPIPKSNDKIRICGDYIRYRQILRLSKNISILTICF